MGKAFSKEIAEIPRTLEWAQSVEIEPLSTFVEELRFTSLLAVGSGGSSTACHLAALLHRHRNDAIASQTTPLDVLLTQPGIHRGAVLLASASGRNADVLAALEACITAE